MILAPYCLFTLPRRRIPFLCLGVTRREDGGVCVWVTLNRKNCEEPSGVVSRLFLEDVEKVVGYVEEKRQQERIENFFFQKLQEPNVIQKRVLRCNPTSEERKRKRVEETKVETRKKKETQEERKETKK